MLPGFLPRVQLGHPESAQRERKRLRQVGPHRRAREVRELHGAPRGFGGVSGERGSRLVEGLKDGFVVSLDRDASGGERAASVSVLAQI